MRWLPRFLIDEWYAGAGGREAIIHATPATAIPEEVHRRDKEPAAGIDGLDVGYVTRTPRTLYAGLEDDGGVAGGGRADVIAARRGARGPVACVAHMLEVFIPALVL